jgi:DNA-binding beta-propeller fold protein YncE
VLVFAILPLVVAFPAVFAGLQPLLEDLPVGTSSDDPRAERTFGGEGSGVGLFQDPRHIAVDGLGRIYVGEYQTGRIQVFDPTGTFRSLWRIDSEAPDRGLAVGRDGTTYVLQRGRIFLHKGETGSRVGQLAYGDDRPNFEAVVATVDGGFVAVWDDAIVRFDAQGQPALTIAKAIAGRAHFADNIKAMAVDGLGNMYVLGHVSENVFVFAPEGQFVTRFGGTGDAPGQLRAASAIAVDGHGRVYVSDLKGIQVFEPDGRYLRLIKPDTYAFGITVDEKDALYAVTAKKKVLKYNLSGPK